MAHSKPGRKKSPKRILALPDLEHAKTAVLTSLLRQWSAHLRPRHPRVRRVVLLGAPPRVQPHSGPPLPHSP
jgi:hypothetical protein